MAQSVLQQIIHNLNQGEPLKYSHIEQYTAGSQLSQSCFIGLLTIFYNLVHDPKLIISLNQRSDQILHLKGYILAQFSKNLQLPEPANFIAQFNYDKFEQFCKSNDLGQLSRHSKGIYPLFDINQHKPLQFLPYYNIISQEDGRKLINAPIGNRSWKTSRKVVKAFYDKKVKQQLIPQWQSDPKSIANAIKLCYILLLGLEDQMQEYIQLLGSSQNSKKLRVWYQNYKSFVEQGIDLYAEDKIPQKPSIMSIQAIILCTQMSIIGIINEYRINPTSEDLPDYLVAMIQPIQELKCQNEQNKYLLLALLFKISEKILLPQKRGEYNPARQSYLKIGGQSQYFDRIFYSQEQILQKYRSGKLYRIPEFDYSLNMMKQIYQICFRKNMEQFLMSQKLLKQLDPTLVIQVLSNSTLLSSLNKNDDLGDITMGKRIVSILKKPYLQKYLEDEHKKEPKKSRNFLRNWRKFLQLWSEYHESMQNQNLEKMINLFQQSYLFHEKNEDEKKKYIELKEQALSLFNNKHREQKQQDNHLIFKQRKKLEAQLRQQKNMQQSLYCSLVYPSQCRQSIKNYLVFLCSKIDSLTMKTLSKPIGKNCQQFELLKEIFQRQSFQSIIFNQKFVDKKFKNFFLAKFAKIMALSSDFIQELSLDSRKKEMMDIQPKKIAVGNTNANSNRKNDAVNMDQQVIEIDD